MIKIVTMTGADESVYPEDLLSLSDNYPFVEWAILVMAGRFGRPRFPSLGWIEHLISMKGEVGEESDIKLSLHLCGKYVNDFLVGDIDFIANDLSSIWDDFDRVQINTHGIGHLYNAEKLEATIRMFPEKEFILQYDQVNKRILEEMVYARGLTNVSTLFDLSHGAGILPTHWPELLQGIKCGYAGGISPLNIEGEIKKIQLEVGETGTWIDMETHIRSVDDKLFDLEKVERCLEISSRYVDNR